MRTGQRRASRKASEDRAQEYIPQSMRSARRVRNDMWPHIWMSFVSIILLAAALAIVAYRMGAQSCR